MKFISEVNLFVKDILTKYHLHKIIISSYFSLNMSITINRITGAKVVERPPKTSFTPTSKKRDNSGKLKPPPVDYELPAEAETKANVIETEADTAMRLGSEGVGIDYLETIGSNHDDDDGSNHDDSDDDDHDDDGFNGNLDDNGSDADQDAYQDPTTLVFTSENNVYYDGHGYARRVGKENDCYIEFSVDETTLVIKQFICLNGGKLLLYHMIKDLEEKGYDFTNIKLTAVNLNPNQVNPKLFYKDIFNQQNFQKDNSIFIEMKDLKYIDGDGNFTKKYHDMIPNGYIRKYIDNDKVKYRFTPKYYHDMKRNVIENYKAMGFEYIGKAEFIGTKEEIKAILDITKGGAKKRKTKRKTKHYKKTKRRTKHYKKTNRRTKHDKQTKRRRKK